VVNPSGKLAETFPLQLEDTPAHINFPGENGQVRYGEGLFIGYRYYDAKRAPVLFPFGYGLSYTTFAYSNAHVSATTFRDVDGVTVSVDVTNTGAVAGKEIVQVYVRDCQCKLVRPKRNSRALPRWNSSPARPRPSR
jgi:beta-glucosidase